ncbi:hypothetical protein AABB24_028578 [Solanum stoloniferum]|uniref:Peptidase A1 domain-containing protein n=1 Tax=Solanum stoloniferum TaxID=62892 RepID=A0ABD2S8A0_9SOLN
MTISLTAVVLLTTTVLMLSVELAAGYTFSSRLIHGFSDEAMSFWTSKGKSMTWPKRESVEHMRLLLSNDWKRQKLKLGSQKQLLFPSEGNETHFYGNDLSCKQSGNYLSGAALDGVMGLRPGEISVPSLLAKSRFVPHSFSLCFGKSSSGTIFFGDKGPENQRRSSFVSLDGNYNTHVVEVQHYCVGGTCPKQSGFQGLVDSRSSFIFLPSEIFTKVVTEFEEQMNATRLAIEDFSCCYKASSQGLLNIPSMKLLLAANQSFVIQNPMFTISSGQLFTKKLLVEMLEAYYLRRTRVTARRDPKFAMSDGEQIGHGANWCRDT